MKKITVAELAKMINEGLANGSLLPNAELVVGYDSGSCTTVVSAGPNPLGELYLDTNE